MRIGSWLGETRQALYHVGTVTGNFVGFDADTIGGHLRNIAEECDKIALHEPAKYARRIDKALGEGLSRDQLQSKISDLRDAIGSEMHGQLFFWSPPHRANFYSRDVESIIGQECCSRFPSIQREIEEAVKCYALGRYTACAFHMSRSTEAGMHGLARAINYAPPNNNWNLVFRELGNQFKLLPQNRPNHWQTHSDFLETTWADLRAVSKAWRNDIAHLVDTYGEEEAKDFLAIIPIFLRDLAKKMDENGTLY
jgi:hypothetical protein